MIDTVTRKRIEILLDTPLVPLLVRYAEEVGIGGWSLLRVEAGGGRHGEWTHDELTGAAAKAILLLIASNAKAEALLEKLAPILDSHRLLLTMCDVQVVRAERFT